LHYITFHYLMVQGVGIYSVGIHHKWLGFTTTYQKLVWFGVFIHPFSHKGHSTLRNVILRLVTRLIFMKCDTDIVC